MRFGVRTVVERRFVGQIAVPDFGDEHPVVAHAEHAVVGYKADGGRVESPFVEDVKDFLLAALFGDEQHALLRLAEHDLVGGHARFALGDVLQVDLDAGAGAAAHLAGRTREAGGAHVLNADNGAGVHGFEAGFKEELFKKRVAHLHVGPLLLGLFGELVGGHGGAVDAVAAGLGADIDDGIADTFGPAEEDLVLRDDAEGKDVDERVAVVGLVEDAFAADGGDAEAVAVVGDAADDAFEDAPVARPGFGIVEGTEADGIEHGDGPRAHCEDIAQDAADTGGRALEGLDEARVVVGLDLEGDAVAVTYINDAGVFARAEQDELAPCRQLFEVNLRRFVGAVFAPHHAEDAEFSKRGFAPEEGENLLVFVRREGVRGDDFRSDGAH